jgi:two-component system chemotaxis sensor kinase CheA
VRLSADVLSAARDALLHAVRNAVAHGIESDRNRAGKPPIGVIELEVSQRGPDAVFVCRDDGAGLDIGAARRALAQAGRRVEGVSDAAIVEELLIAGVSTAARVTGIAGRGVGLDVLRETAARMSGRVRLSSRPSHGFSVELSLPMTVAAFTGAVCECGGKTVSVPLAAVVETKRVARADITLSGGAESLRHQNAEIPFAQLEQLLGTASGGSREVCSVLIVRGKDGVAAVGVDRLLGTRATLLRPLPAAARATPLVAGASLDALGNPELVLDADGLVAAVRAVSARRAPLQSKRRPILVVDDSLTTRMLEQSILESAGYEVELAASGEEGLSKAREKAFALFLVDVEMPGIDGFTFIDRARVDPVLANVPAVLVSSRSSPEDFARGKAVGARGYIVKERFDQRELLGLIHTLVDA